jgi:hypothetical protein
MNIPIKIKRGRGRPRKSDINPSEPIIIETPEEPIMIETPEEPITIEAPEEPIVKKVRKTKQDRKVKPEPIVKQVRKVNQWVEHCTEVKNRQDNVGKSYREILKIAKLDYQK